MALIAATCLAFVPPSSVGVLSRSGVVPNMNLVVEPAPPAGFTWADSSLEGVVVPTPEPTAAPTSADARLMLPGGAESVDALTGDMVKSFSDADLLAAKAALELAIFKSPPFEKPNEQARRRNLALVYFGLGPKSYSKALVNSKEVSPHSLTHSARALPPHANALRSVRTGFLCAACGAGASPVQG